MWREETHNTWPLWSWPEPCIGEDTWFFVLKCKSVRMLAQSAGETATSIDWVAAVGQCPSGLNCILENPTSILEDLTWSLPHPPHPRLLEKPGLPWTWGLRGREGERERERMGESFLNRKCVGYHRSSSLPLLTALEQAHLFWIHTLNKSGFVPTPLHSSTVIRN